MPCYLSRIHVICRVGMAKEHCLGNRLEIELTAYQYLNPGSLTGDRTVYCVPATWSVGLVTKLGILILLCPSTARQQGTPGQRKAPKMKVPKNESTKSQNSISNIMKTKARRSPDKKKRKERKKKQEESISKPSSADSHAPTHPHRHVSRQHMRPAHMASSQARIHHRRPRHPRRSLCRRQTAVSRRNCCDGAARPRGTSSMRGTASSVFSECLRACAAARC